MQKGESHKTIIWYLHFVFWIDIELMLKRRKSIREKLEKYGDSYLPYRDIAMPELRVDVSVQGCEEAVTVKMKLKRVIRYQHLTRDFVDEADYPPTQEYFLYSDKTVEN